MTPLAETGAGVPGRPATSRTLPAVLLERARSAPGGTGMRKKTRGRWHTYSWSEYALRASLIGRGLLELGVQPGERIALQSENRPAWLLCDLAILGIGASTVGIHPTSSPAEVDHVLSHCGARVVIVEDQEQLDKVLTARHDAAGVRKIVLVDPSGLGPSSHPMVMTLADLERLGEQRPPADFDRRVAELEPTSVALVLYTPGATGPPKGAVLTHANIMAAAASTGRAFGVGPDDDVLSYLPLSHVAERLVSVINAVVHGYAVNFPQSTATVAQDLQELQPTFFLGAPRVWEKFLATVEVRMREAPRLKRANYRFWMAMGRRLAARRLRGERWRGPTYFLGWLLLYRMVRKKMGLGRVREAICATAPIAPQVLEWFWALGVAVREGYGLTESTAIATLNPRVGARIGTVGKALLGVEVKVAYDGEILLRAPSVFARYLGDEAATNMTLDPDRWLHTGDLGSLDDDGYLTITGRKQDVIVTAAGENISPAEIENKLKACPYVKEAIVLGEGRSYLTALIGIELDTVGSWAAGVGLGFTTYGDLTSKPEVRRLIGDVVAGVNDDLAHVGTIERFELLPRELDKREGELTPTQKVNRAAITVRFAGLVEAMYANGTGR